MNAASAGLIAAVGEDEIIRQFTEGLPLGPEVVVGPGDDCAVVKTGRAGVWQLLKTDAVVEGVHFLPHAALSEVGWKAMARVVSDVAAMGGTPRQALVTLVLPAAMETASALKLYEGLRRCAAHFQVSIVGGETTRGPVTMVSVSMTGTVKAARCVRRDGARAGDVIYVTGRLGGSIRGHHLTFVPRLEEARWLAATFRIHAMMDLSDGLGKDLPRLARASGMGFHVDAQALPLNPNCNVSEAWGDGEDYELLFCVSPRTAKSLEAAWKVKFPDVPLTSIGRIVPAGQGMTPPDDAGWDAFG